MGEVTPSPGITDQGNGFAPSPVAPLTLMVTLDDMEKATDR
nr:hypothetical protein [uncultured Azospirillum sp.]